MKTELTPESLSAVAARGSAVMRKLAESNEALAQKVAELEAEVAGYKRSERVRELAESMEEKGLNSDLSMDEKIASIAKYKDLDQVEAAIKMAGSGSVDLASVSDDPAPGADPTEDFHQFCVSGYSNA